MNRVQVDQSMNGLPMDTVIDPTPTQTPMHDKAVNDGPTTANGPLSLETASLDDREITAHYATAQAAEAARDRLLDAGLTANAIRVIPNAAEDANLRAEIKPADDSILGRIREAILPDETTKAARQAVAHNDAILVVTPERDQVELVVQIIEASHPTRFDADLERWRNKG